jgi:hypothetical protein
MWGDGGANVIVAEHRRSTCGRDYVSLVIARVTLPFSGSRLLEEFLGWSLPMVPGFPGEDIRLYLEVIFPLFYVEQKFGWSGVAPRVPTHFRIRDPLPRAVEYVLGLCGYSATSWSARRMRPA